MKYLAYLRIIFLTSRLLVTNSHTARVLSNWQRRGTTHAGYTPFLYLQFHYWKKLSNVFFFLLVRRQQIVVMINKVNKMIN